MTTTHTAKTSTDISRHLYGLAELAASSGDLPVPIRDALSRYLQGIGSILDTETGDVASRQAILLSMDFLLEWEEWLKSGPAFSSRATLTFHWLLLRAAKGAVKRWRLWRIEVRD